MRLRGWGPHNGICALIRRGSRELSLFFPSPCEDTEEKQLYRRDERPRDFPGDPVVKNPPCNAGHVGSIPGQGTKIPHAVKQPSLNNATTEPARSRAHGSQLEGLSTTMKDPACCNQDLMQLNK